MLKTERMVKVELLGPKTKAYAIIDHLHRKKLMHIIDHQRDGELDIGSPLEQSEQVADLLLKIRGFLAWARGEKISSAHETKNTFSFLEIEEKMRTLIKEHEHLQVKIREVSASITEEEQLIVPLKALNALYLNIEEYQPYQSLARFVGTVNETTGLKQALGAITKKHILYLSTYQRKPIIALFVEKQKEQETAALLSKQQFQAIEISKILNLSGSPLYHLNKINAEKAQSIQLLDAYTEEQRALIKKNLPFLKKAEVFLAAEAEKREAPLRFGATEKTFIARGWIPEKKLDTLKEELNNLTEKKYHIEIKEIEHHDKVPIILDNPALSKPFEFFLNLYTLPNYHEMDPTIFLFLTFPFFFGMMLGDIGYGLVTLILFWYLKKKIPAGKLLLTAMMYAAIVSIFFGLIFGEFFGFEHVSESVGDLLGTFGINLERMIVHNEIVYDLPRLVNRMHSEMNVLGNVVPSILVFGGILGFIHVNIGLFLGFLNEYHHQGLKHAIFAKASWYVLEIAVALLVLIGLKIIALPMMLGYIMLVLAVIMLYKGEGIQGLVELPSIFSNILSYLRLAAVGLASVGLAVVVNENMVAPFMEKGGIFVIVGIIIFTLGHIINIALGILGPFLHALRLHYVEFFSKFYKGGGVPFVAFGETKNKE